MMRVLVVRLDSDGDVLLSGPAIRAIAGHPAEVTLLCGPAGAQAAALLPGVDHTIEWTCPWIAPDPGELRLDDMRELTERIAGARFDLAVVLTSAHQSCLPTALLLRTAGVPAIAGISTDYPGALLDVRLRPDIDFVDDTPEPERALALVNAAGFRLPPGDDGALRVRRIPEVSTLTGTGPYVVVHPGATVPARRWPAGRCAEAVRDLVEAGHRVLVTGGPTERVLTAAVAADAGTDLGGATSFAQLGGVLAGADAVVVGNTGPAHLAAAVETPVVSLFSPVVPAVRWAPYRVPTVLLGDQTAACRGTRARECPVPGHPCLSTVTARDVVAAVRAVRKKHSLKPQVVR
ncbi:glycosyltransferase family 9 protein [Actinophytocola gossypii]|uniref:Glycosyltransferase family 9 protein n=1 Tax=Actinophytocola gossypii TaxID=2812003 RepID=A0ABT2J6L0_9PSEU|nr:glycosyltransferase family 9 protein [Actinophytocola gossypii]MCT2583484.1 glycosyltransferase family 9 protein [Actinophytocola gossypii]